MELDKAEYIPGETATATIHVSVLDGGILGEYDLTVSSVVNGVKETAVDHFFSSHS
jgi:hypothetical protein